MSKTRTATALVILVLFAAACMPVTSMENASPPVDQQGADERASNAADLSVDLAAPAAGADLETAAPLPTITAHPATATVVPTQLPSPAAPIMQTAVPTATFTPHPFFPFTIPALRMQNFEGGPVQIRAILQQNDDFSRYYIDYPSDDLTISGVMHVPTGRGPFPVLILLHGYVVRDQYYAGTDTSQAAEYFARHGYLVLAPDLRSWGESDSGLSLFHMGLVVDVLNLISSVSTLPAADSSRIGLWGHSMGGGIATKILTIDDRVQAAVLYAPNSADDADLIARWGYACLPGQSEEAGDHCNPAEIIPADSSPDLIEGYLSAAADPNFLQQIAPFFHLASITAPVQIHIGTADGEFRTETPPEWSAKLAAALQSAGRDVVTYTYPGQGHFFSGASWNSMLDRALVLFDERLKTDP